MKTYVRLSIGLKARSRARVRREYSSEGDKVPAKQIITDFCLLSSYGTSRVFQIIYCDESFTVWQVFASDVRYMRCSQNDKGETDFIDFDGGPSLYCDSDLFGFGFVDKMWIFGSPEGKKNSCVVLVLCRNVATMGQEAKPV
jgi:hypothetical protein